MKRAPTILFAITMCLLLISCNRNKVDMGEEGLNFETCLSELEERISEDYQLKDFKLIRLRVDIADGAENYCILLIDGMYDDNGIATSWGKSFEISYDDFLALYKVNDNCIVYNTELTDCYNFIVTDIPAWAIKGVYNIMFE